MEMVQKNKKLKNDIIKYKLSDTIKIFDSVSKEKNRYHIIKIKCIFINAR